MAITNITDKVEAMQAKQNRLDRIDALDAVRSAFVLKAMLIAGHVSEHTIDQALNLADTIRVN